MRVTVPAVSFAQHSGLVELLRKTYPDRKVNTEGHPYYRTEKVTIAAAGIDTCAVEPATDDVLLNLPNFIATPHIGAGSVEARRCVGTSAIEGLMNNFLPEPGHYPFEDRC